VVEGVAIVELIPFGANIYSAQIINNQGCRLRLSELDLSK